MLVYPPKKALVLRLRDSTLVKSLIPKAKTIHHDGKEFVAVPHGLDEVETLRSLGINAPSPIHYYYDWPGQQTPFAHQCDTAGFLTLHPRAFNLNGIGTGKTRATLFAFDYMRQIGAVKRAFIITPMSTMERAWGDELFDNFPHLNYAVLHGSKTKRLKLLDNDGFDIYIINHDGIKVEGIEEALAARPDVDLVIIDEISQIARSASADRFKSLLKLTNKQHPRRVWGLTGTPTPNSPTDAWAQCRIVVPDNVPPYFRRFKESVMQQVSTFTWVPRPDAMQLVQHAMQPAIRYSRDECIDLPPCIYQTMEAQLTPQQRTAYKNMLDQLYHEAEEGVLTAVNAGVRAQKLIQIACGVAYGADDSLIRFDPGPRLELLKDIIESAESKVIVYVPFVSVVDSIAQFLRTSGLQVECIHGGVSKTERDRIFAAFQRQKDPKVLIAQPASMSHGLTLTEASTIVWYAPVASNETFEQANGRITRPGQRLTQHIIMLEGTDIERRYYKRLKDKQAVQNLLLDAVRSERALHKEVAIAA